jgi:hypothetical protein
MERPCNEHSSSNGEIVTDVSNGRQEGICRFDDSLPRMMEVLLSTLEIAAIEGGVVLRDASGCLSFFCSRPLAPEILASVSESLRSALGPYARQDLVVAGTEEPATERMLQDIEALPMRVPVGDHLIEIRHIDRRIVGADWMRPPPQATLEGGPAQPRALRIAFASLKGGVGRSTALTIVAAEQARKGRNVLVVDLDLEAPGIASLLLPPVRHRPSA